MYNGKNLVIDAIELEIFYKDLPYGKTWSQYHSLCLALRGDGWRLPTIEELSYMCTLSQLKVLGFSNEYYWSSELTPKISHPQAYVGHRECVYFPGGAKAFQNSTSIGICARPVRTISL